MLEERESESEVRESYVRYVKVSYIWAFIMVSNFGINAQRVSLVFGKGENECGLDLISVHFQRFLLFLQVIVLPFLPLMRLPDLILTLAPILPHLERCFPSTFKLQG